MVCLSRCFDEAVQFDEDSPGPISNDEVLCRTAFGKKAHYNSEGVKVAFIRDSHFLAGELSVWRRYNGTAEELTEIRDQHVRPPGNALWDVFGATAVAIRSIRVASNPDIQAIHAYDDCRTDNDGGKHPKHGVLAICNAFLPGQMTKDDETYVEIRDALFREFLRNPPQWTLPDDERV